MEFTAVILLLTLYFIRPQDWVPGIAGFNVIKPIIALGFLGLLTRSRKSAERAPWRLMRTPHEWIMVVYASYVIATSPVPGEAIGEFVPAMIFFFMTLHSITSAQRLEAFLKWWRWSLYGVALMGLGALTGLDFTQSGAVTDREGGRLALNHWMLNNPNALGHTLIALFPLLWFGVICGKGRPLIRAVMVLVPMAMTCVCLWETQSKGAYVVGAGLIVFAVLLGKPGWVKMAIVALALGGGGTVLSVLPRMQEMGHLRSEEGVVGRLMVWQMARDVTRNTISGEGYKKFAAHIQWEGKLIPKATHSSYVQIGGDLGLPGLMLYLSVLCCGMRTMVSYRGVSPELDRMRGALFSLLLGYSASGWMINRSYHTEFFMIIGAIAAYQQLCTRAARLPATTRCVAQASRRKPPLGKWFFPWRRYGLLDALCAFLALQLVLWTWDYVITSL